MTGTNKKCWICKRTDEESISDFKNLVLDFDEKVDEEYIIPPEIKDVIKDDNITVVPEGADDYNFIMTGFEAFNEKNEIIDIKSDHNVFMAVHICHVCNTIFRSLQSAQNDDIEEMKEAFNEKIDRVISVLMEIKNVKFVTEERLTFRLFRKSLDCQSKILQTKSEMEYQTL